MLSPSPGWTISHWRRAATSGELSEGAYLDWLGQFSTDDPAWIHLATEGELLEQLRALAYRLNTARSDPAHLPLFGVPFAVKDNIDVKGWPTTAACPAFQYFATDDATVVQNLRDAGAVIVGKTNLDQFATGLVGTRSPYGIVRSAFDSEFVAGGSSSGSASVVTRGLLPFTLGTDTAGSGRVPAAFGNIVGLKPTRGTVSTYGVVPACRTLDCVSVFSLTVEDVALVGRLITGLDSKDPYSRELPETSSRPWGQRASKGGERRLGIFRELEFFGDTLAEEAFSSTVERLKGAGFVLHEVDPAPFWALAELLYGGAWVAERAITVGRLLSHEEMLDRVVLGILKTSQGLRAEDAFRSEYRRAELAAKIHDAIQGLDALLVPTTATTFRVSDVLADPVRTNSRLGIYTNFTNLADLAAVAVPGCFRSDGLPTGVTLLGPAFSDERLLRIASRVQRLMTGKLGATEQLLSTPSEAGEVPSDDSHPARDNHPVRGGEQWVPVVVVGAHLSEMPLNYQLSERGARLSRRTRTSKNYRLFALSGQSPQKPGLVRVNEGGQSILVEVWDLPASQLGSFLQEIPPPLGMGTLELADGTWEKGFICEPYALEQATDITSFGGFRAYLESCAE